MTKRKTPQAPIHAGRRRRWLSSVIALAAGTSFAAGYYIRSRKAQAAVSKAAQVQAEQQKEIDYLRTAFQYEKNKNLALSPEKQELMRQLRDPAFQLHPALRKWRIT